MSLEEIRQSFLREVKEENNILNKLISESGVSEQKRRLEHKRYYIRRIISYYDRLIINYNTFEFTTEILLPGPFLGNQAMINHLYSPLMRESKNF
jgi:hypothetical protein